MEKTLRWLNLLLILITFLSYLSPFIDPAFLWFFSLLGMGYPWLLLFNMIFVLIWLFKKHWYCIFSLGCIFVGFNHFQSFIGLNEIQPNEQAEIKVMTLNCMGNYRIIGDTKKRFDQFLVESKPDVILLQESIPKTRPISKKDYPYIFQPKKNLGIYSKFPFVNKGSVLKDIKGNRSTGCLYVDLKINQQIIRVYNIHLQSNKVSQEASKIKEEGNLQKKETWLDIRTILGKLKRATAKRSEQANTIIQHLEGSKYPVIAGGDFNDTPLSYTYRLFAEKLNDGFKERASGIGTTYSGTIPVLRIDYIWTDKDFQVNSHEILKENFSDHYPVISRIQLPQ